MVTGRNSKARVTTAAHDERRLEIILHSADLFDKVGYHKMTMQMLADEAGMGKPTLYHYFPSKAEILYEMHQIHMDALLGDLDADAEANADSAELLVKACASALRQIAEHPGYVRAFMDHYSDLEDEHRKQIRKRRSEYFQRIRKIITDGIAAGRLRKVDPDVTVFAFLGICNWAYKWYPGMATQSPPDVMAKKLCQVILDGIKRQK
ncbi:TetR family transcriptional regulator [Burkholderia sp. FL-7-2-10-S1-D7]|uniref:TetR/AcrR family transcriptional regulator n=1 Tax=Burkholderia sp. FL-7-2-10-S1-D7 TaxID=1637866 RepID=UPI00075AED35|nr:TetR/AcrR family transcriptional regulator [Burkholderia sp. FL-7-2-10-S1-D7]KVF79240.1 TetR family transcriptional regulator [Burkholderia sp. FL-7-2-10-S1-D7]